MIAAKEHRWIVLGTDGRHITLGRHTDPTENEILTAESSLVSQGLSGWLAVIEGECWSKRAKLSVMAVRPLASPSVPFAAAVTAFKEARAAALSQT